MRTGDTIIGTSDIPLTSTVMGEALVASSRALCAPCHDSGHLGHPPHLHYDGLGSRDRFSIKKGIVWFWSDTV